jgi:hypothetical protein
VKKSRLFPVLASLSIVAFFVCGQLALAQQNKSPFRVQIIPPNHALGVQPQANGDGQLWLQVAGFAALPPMDGTGDDEWPCQPNVGANGADCASIATSGLVIGSLAHTWSFADCDASLTTSTNCGQILWVYQDDIGSGDVSVTLTAKQGTGYVLSTGTIDLGPDTAPVGSTVIFSYDTAFGTKGETGKGNGYCAGTKSTCVNPLSGVPINIEVTTKVGTSLQFFKLMKTFSIVLQ